MSRVKMGHDIFVCGCTSEDQIVDEYDELADDELADDDYDLELCAAPRIAYLRFGA